MRLAAGMIFGLIVLCLGAPAQVPERDDVIRVETALVSVPVVVSDRQGRYITGLGKGDFTIFVDGKERKTEFFAAEQEPLRVAILLDTSRSTENILGKIKKAAKEFIRVLGSGDSAMIVTFDYEVRVGCALTSDKKVLERAIKDVDIGEMPGTVMRDAVLETVGKSLNGVTGRKAIILITDGKDFGSYAYENEVLRTLEESDVMIYPVYYETTLPLGAGPGWRRGGRFPGPMGRDRPGRERSDERRRRREAVANQMAREYLNRMADLTAGRFLDKKDNDLDEMFLGIADELRRQYRLGFYRDDETGPDVPRIIKVRVDRPNVAVRSRTSYRLKK